MLQAVLNDRPETQYGQSNPTSPLNEASRKASQFNRTSIRKTLSQALQLKDLAFQTAMAMQGQFDDDASADRARAQAQAVASLTKSWAESVNVARIERGKPLPGSLRPESKPKKPKRSKPQQTLMDQDQPACGPHTTAHSVPAPEPHAQTPQDPRSP